MLGSGKGGPAFGAGGIVLDAEEELRRYQHGFEGRADGLVERIASFPALVDEGHQPGDFLRVDRAPVGATGEIRNNLPGARGVLRGAGEDLAAALDRRFHVGIVRPDDFDEVDAESDVGNRRGLGTAPPAGAAVGFEVGQPSFVGRLLLGRGIRTRGHRDERAHRGLGPVVRPVAVILRRQAVVDVETGDVHLMLTRRHVSANRPVGAFKAAEFGDVVLIGKIVDLRDLLTVDPDGNSERIGRRGAAAFRVELEIVIAFSREIVSGMEGAREREARHIVIRQREGELAGEAAVVAAVGPEAVGRLVARHGGRHFAGAEDGQMNHLLGGGKILFHQDGREREHVADGVEAIAGIVLRKILRGIGVDGQQIANRVVVFLAVETAGGNAAGLGFHRFVGAVEFGFHP